MWRSLFLALGAFACLLGTECLLVDKVVLKEKQDERGIGETAAVRDVVPPDWAPWSLLSCGAVTMLYSFTIPKRGKE